MAETAMKKKILLVDDSRLMLRIEERCLHGTYDVRTATSGAEALAKAIAERPDLVLTDMNLPDVSGRQVIESLALDRRTRGVKAIIVTTKSEIDRLGSGVATLAKPFDPATLLAKVIECLA
jgi:twitching motility two-component system response regulator PilH